MGYPMRLSLFLSRWQHFGFPAFPLTASIWLAAALLFGKNTSSVIFPVPLTEVRFFPSFLFLVFITPPCEPNALARNTCGGSTTSIVCRTAIVTSDSEQHSQSEQHGPKPGAELFGAALTGVGFKLANDPVQAARLSGCKGGGVAAHRALISDGACPQRAAPWGRGDCLMPGPCAPPRPGSEPLRKQRGVSWPKCVYGGRARPF
ncbi:hypothetical protein TraAM80_03562, partial [Trypanosoma rangeli]